MRHFVACSIAWAILLMAPGCGNVKNPVAERERQEVDLRIHNENMKREVDAYNDALVKASNATTPEERKKFEDEAKAHEKRMSELPEERHDRLRTGKLLTQ